LHKRTEIERERIISEEAGAWSEEVVVADSGRERERERERERVDFSEMEGKLQAPN
jgi:hypothetical protein